MKYLTSAACALCLTLGATGSADAADESLRALAEARGFHIGAAVRTGPFKTDATYTVLLKREFNMIVAENAMKWTDIHPARKNFRFDVPDAMVEFAEQNGMAVRGHTLVWHNQIPYWLLSGDFSRDEAIAILREHIDNVVGRYKGRVREWDVVNEAIDDKTNELRRDSFWFQKIGPDYIRLAFEYAHAADPGAKLYYNDYNAEGGTAKANAVFKLVSDLKKAGVPIDGVGWQMHLTNGDGITAAHRKNAKRIAMLGLDLAITELDVRMKLPATKSALAKQAKTYGDVVAFCLTQPNCKSVLTWGVSDRESWVPGFFEGFGAALLFDADRSPKPAYTAVQKALAASGR